MSDPDPWLHFERYGGVAPRDDEELTLADDGTFQARRTIGGRRIGRFEGSLPVPTLRRLRTAVDAASGAESLTLQTPRHGATEVLQVGGRTLELGSNETPRPPWRSLIEGVRALVTKHVLASPKAAIELVADARSARLVHAGDGTIGIDLGSIAVHVVRVGHEGEVLGRWYGRPREGLVDNGEELVLTPRWASADRGWSAPLPFDHPLELAPGDMFQVWVDVPIREGDRARAGRLYVPVLTDG